MEIPLSSRQTRYYEIVEPYLNHGNKPGDREYLANILNNWSPEVDPDHDIGWALHYAISKRDDVAVRMMIDSGVSVTVRQTQDPGFTPLFAAAQYGTLAMVRFFWEQTGPKGRFLPTRNFRPGQLTCLRVAARNGQADVTAYFLEVWDGWQEETSRALLDAASAWCDNTVALLLAKYSFEPEVIQDALCKAGSRRMILGENPTKRPLIIEDHLCQQRLVCRLIDAGGDPDGEDGLSNEPLINIAASYKDCIGAVVGLLEKGANPNRPDPQGRTALYFLFNQREGMYRRKVHASTDALEVLLQHGALPDSADENGETPLHAVARNGTVEQVKLCLSHFKASCSKIECLELRNFNGESMLDCAKATENEEVFKFLSSQSRPEC
ncbi:ankyrin repeat protein [Colletotrichum kahawae]|uniref:Ankyrin repeat protein n=1 Tax=Colletotrichum kahawae TaxID=34407 RepID=A0AAD9YTR4_COLKA|nr:ankyrin repeat protein [Colletotrichum kahawae]